jgi:hypothetical protein
VVVRGGPEGGINYDVLGAHGNTQAPEVDGAPAPAFGHPASLPPCRTAARSQVKLATPIINRLLEFGWTPTIHPDYRGRD